MLCISYHTTYCSIIVTQCKLNYSHVVYSAPAQYTVLCCVAAVCRCMDGSSISLRCRRCSTPWSGAMLLIGTMYSYDVFAATPCCDARLQCKQCRQSVLSGPGTTSSPAAGPAVAPPLKYYSEYSRRVKCQRCSVEDYHFVKPLDELYDVRPTPQHQQATSAALPRI